MAHLIGKLLGAAAAAAGAAAVVKYLHDYTDYRAVKPENLEDLKESGGKAKEAARRTYVALKEKESVREAAGEFTEAAKEVVQDAGRFVAAVGSNTVEFAKAEKERYQEDPEAFKGEFSANVGHMGSQVTGMFTGLKDRAEEAFSNLKETAGSFRNESDDFVSSPNEPVQPGEAQPDEARSAESEEPEAEAGKAETAENGMPAEKKAAEAEEAPMEAACAAGAAGAESPETEGGSGAGAAEEAAPAETQEAAEPAEDEAVSEEPAAERTAVYAELAFPAAGRTEAAPVPEVKEADAAEAAPEVKEADEAEAAPEVQAAGAEQAAPEVKEAEAAGAAPEAKETDEGKAVPEAEKEEPVPCVIFSDDTVQF